MAEDGGNRITVAELGRRFDRFEKESHDSFVSLHRRLDELNYVHPETFAMQMQLEAALRQNMEARIADIAADLQQTRDNLQWIVRTLVAAFVVAVAGVIVAASGWSPGQ